MNLQKCQGRLGEHFGPCNNGIRDNDFCNVPLFEKLIVNYFQAKGIAEHYVNTPVPTISPDANTTPETDEQFCKRIKARWE